MDGDFSALDVLQDAVIGRWFPPFVMFRWQAVHRNEGPSIAPCQFGGDPDYEQCGCIASIGLAAVRASSRSRSSQRRSYFRTIGAGGKALEASVEKGNVQR